MGGNGQCLLRLCSLDIMRCLLALEQDALPMPRVPKCLQICPKNDQKWESGWRWSATHYGSGGWAWRLVADEDAAPPFTVLLLSVDKLEAAAGQPAAARGPATSRPPGGAQTTSTLPPACNGDQETAVVNLRSHPGNSVRS